VFHGCSIGDTSEAPTRAHQPGHPGHAPAVPGFLRALSGSFSTVSGAVGHFWRRPAIRGPADGHVRPPLRHPGRCQVAGSAGVRTAASAHGR